MATKKRRKKKMTTAQRKAFVKKRRKLLEKKTGVHVVTAAEVRRWIRDNPYGYTN